MLMIMSTSQLWQHDLTPGFELMGNPGKLWTDFASDEQVCVIIFVGLLHFCLGRAGLCHRICWSATFLPVSGEKMAQPGDPSGKTLSGQVLPTQFH